MKQAKPTDNERFHETKLVVRFSEVDSYDVAWHGSYVSWLEVARLDLARHFAMDYRSVREAGYALPVISLRIDYKRPALEGDELMVRARLREPVGASFVFDYEVRRQPKGDLIARAETRQVVLNRSGDLLVTLPSVLREAAARIRAYHTRSGD